jgi:hypothetical protein
MEMQTMKKHNFTQPLFFLLIGMVFGFILAPAKNGFGNNTTNYYYKRHNSKTEE